MHTEEIYLDDIECPYCDRDTYIENWGIEINGDKRLLTLIKCDECGNSFYVKTTLDIKILKINGDKNE